VNETRLKFLGRMVAGGAGASFFFADEAKAVNITISITGDGSALRGDVLISASLSPTKNLQKVEFFIDGTLGKSDSSLPFEYLWDTTKVPDGKHTLRADGVYKTRKTTASLEVTVANSSAPSNVAVSAPTGVVT
jgi:Bacterial Ig domain